MGFGYLESSRLLRDFDRFCLARFPDAEFLTEEICLAWATKKDTEGNNTFRNRMMPVRGKTGYRTDYEKIKALTERFLQFLEQNKGILWQKPEE